ncbi:MAG: PilZ domain-containing protein [Archangiaceae bacterium]|nr:PilZ domain-containing protein [Archangiaceae bacterium]
MKISTPERMRVAYLKDLSEGGVFIRTDKPLQLERVVDVDLLAPGRVDPIRLRGRITRVQNDEASRLANLQGMGVKFIELTAQADAALKGLVQEYAQARPAVPVASQVPDSQTVALKQALETSEVLRTTLAQRESELQQEHDRRQELSVRVLALTQELEGVKTRGSDGQTIALDALKVELTAARSELSELKERLKQAEASAEGYRQELAVLEEDDASTRRLAETLAQAKQKLEVELKRSRDELSQHVSAIEAERSSGNARSAETTRLLETERGKRTELEGRLEELAAQNESLKTRILEMEPMLDQARQHVNGLSQAVTEAGAARARIDTLEKALSEEKQRSARLQNRERELRQLVAAISAKGDDVVVMDDGLQQTVESSGPPVDDVPPMPLPPIPSQASAIQDAIGDVLGKPSAAAEVFDEPSGHTQIMMRMPAMPQSPAPLDPFMDEHKPGQTLVMMTMPEDETSMAGLELDPPLPSEAPAPAAAPEPAAAVGAGSNDIDSLPVEVDSLDVDMADWGGQAIAVGPAPGQQQFLERLRQNDKLVRRPTFFEYAAADKDEEQVIGSLMGGDRLEDLKVLSRGQCTPEQLESHLLKFHQLGLIGFDG